MKLLHIAYPDKTTQLDKVQLFMNVKQIHPMVAVYTNEKAKAYRQAFGDQASFDDVMFVTSWRMNLHPKIAKKLDEKVNLGVMLERAYTFEELVKCAAKKEVKLVNDPSYVRYFQSNNHATQGRTNSDDGNDGGQRTNGCGICRFFNTPRGCVKGNRCDFRHVSNANATTGAEERPPENDGNREQTQANMNAAGGGNANSSSRRGGQSNRGRGRGGKYQWLPCKRFWYP